VDARALQVATWEIVRETTSTLNVLNGSILFGNPSNDSANNAVRAQVYARANVMLSSLTGNPDDRLDNFYALTRLGNQDIIVFDTPEPASIILCGAGLAILYFKRRRRLS
jgi:hypothetical protein